MMATVRQLAQMAKTAAGALASVPTDDKNAALLAIADALVANEIDILAANAADVDIAHARGISSAMIDRLTLTPARIAGIADAVRDVAKLDDPVGEILSGGNRPNGLSIKKVRVPMGLIGMIYESRPNVTVDAAVLCLKAGNAVILRGGSDAIQSNTALATVMRDALATTNVPRDSVVLIEDTSRDSAVELMTLTGVVDLLIPRGSASLISTVVQNAKVPVIETGVGNCHVYIDDSADLGMGLRIIENAKCTRPGVCNAAETLLVHRAVAEAFLPMVQQTLGDRVVLRGCERTRAILGGGIEPATDDDWATEYLDFILAVRVVDSFDDAVAHIRRYTTYHSECIVTNEYRHAERFTRDIDAAAVYVNASTRFTDGGEFGLGAEIGISTQKMHARGPMGLRELTSIKYIITGDGQIR